MWYMGNEFDKDTNKSYKTLENGLKAAEKNGMKLFDEDGQIVNAAPEAESEVAADADQGQAVADQEQENTEQEEVHGKIRRVFDGMIRLRRSPSWSPEAVCGVSIFDEKTVIGRQIVDGVPMFETVDGYFITGAPELVQFVED